MHVRCCWSELLKQQIWSDCHLEKFVVWIKFPFKNIILLDVEVLWGHVTTADELYCPFPLAPE